MTQHAARRRVLVVGGVAGGASCATRLRRLDERCEIVIFDRGPHVSFANCGLPYYVGNVIADEKKLLVASNELFRTRFAIDVRTRHDVLSIDRAAHELVVRDLESGAERRERYDALVLAPGAAAFRPPVAGVDRPGVFVVRTIPDSQRIRAWLDERGCKRAVVAGGGFIGLEMAENLHRRGISVTLLEKLEQLVPPIDPEMAALVARHVREHGIEVRLGEGLAAIDGDGEALVVRTDRDGAIDADVVVLALGVRPEVGLARAAGLTIGARGGITVNAHMQTSDPAIWAVGDAIEVRDRILGQDTMLALAGPANRQGRVAADAIAGRSREFHGVLGTAIVEVLGLTVACTGPSEKALRRAGVTGFAKVYLHPGHHAGYYPHASPIHLKLLYATDGGRILGAQAVGAAGVDKRIDVLSAMLQKGATVDDLAEAELCYAPQFGAAKDPVNVAGMLAQNAQSGDMPLADWSDLGATDALLLDVREPDEVEHDGIPGATNIPMSQLRDRLDEVPTDRLVRVYCAAGQRGYFAQRFLVQHGRRVENLSGGLSTCRAMEDAGLVAPRSRTP